MRASWWPCRSGRWPCRGCSPRPCRAGLGLLALPIGAILATLLSLGRNSFFSAAGVFYAGFPAVAAIWLRSDADAGPAGRDLPDRGRRDRGHGRFPVRATDGRAAAQPEASRPTRPGRASSARWSRARSSAASSGWRCRAAPSSGWRLPAPCWHWSRRRATSRSPRSNAALVPRTRAPYYQGTEA